LYGEGNLANKMLEFEKKYGEKFRKWSIMLDNDKSKEKKLNK
jgi:hypothetical protein